ncbi:MAG: sulfate adenylyltransferase, partial [Candidatus Nanohaloarchaea archaeon]|nr:sulfate adenylyltransferase [Candidatus Nanohaloarchaea archaeon]
MIAPHGGRLVDRTVSDRKRERLLNEASELPSIQIDQPLVKDLQNIADGRYSPLTGFLNQNNFRKVVRDKTLEDGTVWTVPITLDIDDDKAEELEEGEQAAIQGPGGNALAVIDVEQIYSYDKQQTVRHLYGTDDTDHPGVAMYLDKGDHLVGGDIQLLQRGFTQFQDYDLAPAETRVLFREKGWDTVVGFQTRNAPHR